MLYWLLGVTYYVVYCDNIVFYSVYWCNVCYLYHFAVYFVHLLSILTVIVLAQIQQWPLYLICLVVDKEKMRRMVYFYFFIFTWFGSVPRVLLWTLTPLFEWWEGYLVHKNCLTHPQRFSSGTIGGRKPKINLGSSENWPSEWMSWLINHLLQYLFSTLLLCIYLTING